MLSYRSDAHPAPGLSPLRQLMPQILRRRMDAVVFLREEVAVDSTRAWLETERDQSVTLFQVVIAALVRTLHDRPQANRFVKGGRLWQRDHVALTFAVKKSFKDSGRLVSTKVRFEEGSTLWDVVDQVAEAIGESRGGSPRRERMVNRGGGVPRPLRAMALQGSEVLDQWGLLPANMVDNSPLHTSLMLSNLGSLGLDGALHHLYEHGTCSINMTLGKVEQKALVDGTGHVQTPWVAPVTFAYDERIADGYYMARTIERFAELLQDPDLLMGE